MLVAGKFKMPQRRPGAARFGGSAARAAAHKRRGAVQRQKFPIDSTETK
jgi:hypothetical protein